jgi:hypothetical protein
MINLLLADLSSLRLFPANHKFGLIAQALLTRIAIRSWAMGLGLVRDAAARSQWNQSILLTLLGESEEIENRLQGP